jgi:hypothetical protein
VREKLEAVNTIIESEAGGKGAMDEAVNAKAAQAIALEREKAKEKQQKLVKAVRHWHGWLEPVWSAKACAMGR